jgi:hypothetical protein
MNILRYPTLAFYIFSIFFVWSAGAVNAQKKQPDKVVLQNTETRTGKVTDFQGDMLRLRLADKSEILIPYSDIDTIMGLSHRTRFFSTAIGAINFKYYSPFLLENTSAKGAQFQFRYGKFRSARWARFVQVGIIPQKDFTVTKLGLGLQYYAIKRHYNRLNGYVGCTPELNFVRYNMTPFVTLSTHIGTSYMTHKGLRFFSELTWQKPIFNIGNERSWGLQIGIRLNREFLNYYQNMNEKVRLKR